MCHPPIRFKLRHDAFETKIIDGFHRPGYIEHELEAEMTIKIYEAVYSNIFSPLIMVILLLTVTQDPGNPIYLSRSLDLNTHPDVPPHQRSYRYRYYAQQR